MGIECEGEMNLYFETEEAKNEMNDWLNNPPAEEVAKIGEELFQVKNILWENNALQIYDESYEDDFTIRLQMDHKLSWTDTIFRIIAHKAKQIEGFSSGDAMTRVWEYLDIF